MTPTPNLSPKDSATIGTVVLSIAGLLATLHPGWHPAPYVPAVSLALGVFAPWIALFVAKHHLAGHILHGAQAAAAGVADASAVVSALPASPGTADLAKRVAAVEAALSTVSTALGGAKNG